jgi:hypothetical protein
LEKSGCIGFHFMQGSGKTREEKDKEWLNHHDGK